MIMRDLGALFLGSVPLSLLTWTCKGFSAYLSGLALETFYYMGIPRHLPQLSLPSFLADWQFVLSFVPQKETAYLKTRTKPVCAKLLAVYGGLH